MYKVNYYKNRKRYIYHLPVFNGKSETDIKKQKREWVKNELMEEHLYYIKNLIIDSEDVYKMRFSDSIDQLSFYILYSKRIIKTNKMKVVNNLENRSLIATIITSDWLIDKDKLGNTSSEDINNECIEIQKEIICLERHASLNQKKIARLEHRLIQLENYLYYKEEEQSKMLKKQY